MTQRSSVLPQLELPTGWSAEQHDGYVAMLSPSGDAELRVTTVNPPLEPGLWLGGVVRKNRSLGREIAEVQLGSLGGYGMEISALGNRIRAWFLHSGELGIVITYRAAESVGTRDDAAIQRALDTLATRSASN